MSTAQLYDTSGASCTVTRRTEPRVAAQVWAALGDAQTVLNVGAGTNRDLLALDAAESGERLLIT